MGFEDPSDRQQSDRVDINVSSSPEDYITIALEDAETGETLNSVMGAGLPVPDVGELVTISAGEIGPENLDNVENIDDILSSHGELYEVVKRSFGYSKMKINHPEGDTETTVICNVFLRVEENES